MITKHSTDVEEFLTPTMMRMMMMMMTMILMTIRYSLKHKRKLHPISGEGKSIMNKSQTFSSSGFITLKNMVIAWI